MRRPEQEMQIALVKVLVALLPPQVFFVHYPAGGKRTKAEAGILKAMGQKSGVCDLLFWFQGRGYGIELKIPGESLSMAQRARHIEMRAAGMEIETCRSVDDVIAVLNHWKFPLRGQLAA